MFGDSKEFSILETHQFLRGWARVVYEPIEAGSILKSRKEALESLGAEQQNAQKGKDFVIGDFLMPTIHIIQKGPL